MYQKLNYQTHNLLINQSLPKKQFKNRSMNMKLDGEIVI